MKENAVVRQIDDHRVEYDFSSFGLIKRLRIAIGIIRFGEFTVTGKRKNKIIFKYE